MNKGAKKVIFGVTLLVIVWIVKWLWLPDGIIGFLLGED